jgi:hypothetical protein
MSMRPMASLLLLLGSAACMEPEARSPILGDWGGEHLGLVATLEGAELEFDCAAGRIGAAIVPDAGGRFSVSGFHFPGHGGPIGIGPDTVKVAARYDGTVQGNRMTISVTLIDWAVTLGPYTLIRGASPRVFKCL